MERAQRGFPGSRGFCTKFHRQIVKVLTDNKGVEAVSKEGQHEVRLQ